MNNWIKISRCLVRMKGYNSEPFCKPMCFIDLTLMASFSVRQKRTKFGEITLQRGEIAISERDLASKWKVTRRHCNTILTNLVKEGWITIRVEKGTSIITINNYDQLSDNEPNTEPKSEPNTEPNKVKATKGKSSGYKQPNEQTEPNTEPNTAPKSEPSNIYKDINRKNINKENIINKLIISKKGGTPFPSAEIIEFWNAEMDKAKAIVPRMKTMTDLRKRMAAARLREYDAEDFVAVIENCAKSNFLNGHNDRGWTPDFTWAMGPDHFAKILEGRYDNVTTNAVNTTAKFNVNDLWK